MFANSVFAFEMCPINAVFFWVSFKKIRIIYISLFSNFLIQKSPSSIFFSLTNLNAVVYYMKIFAR